MTDQAKVAALAEQLTRLRRLPFWATMENGNGSRKTLDALSGVAAKVRAEHGICVEAAHGGFAVFRYLSRNVTINGWDCEGFEIENLLGHIESCDSYEEAEIAALKQVETEKKQ